MYQYSRGRLDEITADLRVRTVRLPFLTRILRLQVTRLPRSVQPFVRACMQPLRTQGAELLLSSDFFGRPVRAAHAFLAALQPSEQDALTRIPGME